MRIVYLEILINQLPITLLADYFLHRFGRVGRDDRFMSCCASRFVDDARIPEREHFQMPHIGMLCRNRDIVLQIEEELLPEYLERFSRNRAENGS